MLKLRLVFFCLINYILLNAQTGIGTTSPDPSAKLDISATNKGLLPPRVTLTGYMDNSTISNPATGLLVYNTGSNANLAAGYYYWNGNAWATIATSGGSGSFAASYLRGSANSSVSININNPVPFSTIDNTAGSNISLNTSNGKITLTAGNTYRLIASVPNFSGSRPSFIWYNETAGANFGSAVNGYTPTDGAGNGSFGGIAEAIITPNVNTVVYLKLVSVSNSSSSGSISIFPNGDFLGGTGYPWFEAQVIAGNAPVTGQSVDYVQASLSATQALSAAGNVIFNVSNGAGISVTSGGFNLLANKTYKLEGAIGGTSGGYAYYGWVDNANNLLPGGSMGVVMKAGNGYVDAPQDKAVVYYTPTSNTTVYLRVLTVSGGVTAYPPNATAAYSSAWANITQIGSSAIINPWVLNGNDVYNITGKVGIGTNAPTTKLDVSGDVNVTGKINVSDPSGNVVTKVSGYVNAGNYIVLDNIKATVASSGNRGLCLATVSGSFICNISGTYGNTAGGSGSSARVVTYSTTVSNSAFGWNFGAEGDTATYIINDTTNNKVYRVIVMIGYGYNNNFISIERLY
jgi:hypothetical protein